MRRIVWVAVGAVGGVLAYRRAQQAMADAKERGVVLSAQQVGASAVTAVVSAKALAASASQRTSTTTATPGSAAAKVMSRARTAQRPDQGE